MSKQNESVVVETENTNSESLAHGNYQDNDILQIGNLALSIGRTMSGRHTVTLGYINREGKFSTRIPLYVAINQPGLQGLKPMGNDVSVSEGLNLLLAEADQQLRAETEEMINNRRNANENPREKVQVVRSPGKTEREREKKLAAKGQSKK